MGRAPPKALVEDRLAQLVGVPNSNGRSRVRSPVAPHFFARTIICEVAQGVPLEDGEDLEVSVPTTVIGLNGQPNHDDIRHVLRPT